MENEKKAEKRIKKPTVKTEQRNDWLKRFEMGESASKIADIEDWDVRTVRKHVEFARQEREIREARAAVLRDALEKHHFDLIKHAEALNSQVLGIGRGEVSLDSDLVENALRQHLPRSPLWTYRLKWQNLLERQRRQQNDLAANIEKAVKGSSRIRNLEKQGMDQIVAGVVDTLKFQAKNWAGGLPGLNVEDNLMIEPAGEGLANLRYGFAQLGKTNKDQAAGVKKLIKLVLIDMETAIRKWDAFLDLEKTYKEIEIVKKKLREELAVIRLRRILPGRCKYCPL